MKSVIDTPSDCQQAEALFEDFLDGELPSEEERWLSAHLEQCDDCQEELWSVRLGRKSRELLVPAKDHGPALAERRERVLAQIGDEAPRARSLHLVRRWWWVAASAAAMVLAAFLAWPPTGAVVEQPTIPQEQTPEAVVERETEAPPEPELNPPVATAEAPAERKVTEVRFLWDGVQIVWIFDSHFKP